MRLPALTLAALAVAGTAAAGDWPQFRGPAGSGVAPGGPLPAEWGADKNVRWKAAVPGAGWSSPVVVGDKVFVTTAVSAKGTKPQPFGGGGGGGRRPGGGAAPGGGRPPGGGGGRGDRPPPDDTYRWQVLCLSAADGKVLWTRTAAEKKPSVATHSTNTYASETPVSDGERVYAYFGMTGVYCYDLAGTPLWSKDLGSYPMQNGWGTGSSPALHAGKLFVQCDNEKRSFVVALDAATGKEVWRADRAGKSSWSTPLVWTAKGRTDLVCCGDRRVTAYAPDTGKVVWELGGIDGTFNSSPTADAERVYFGTGSGTMGAGPLFAVRAGATGDITLKRGETANAGVAWSKAGAGSRTASPVAYDGLLYVPGARGTVACFEAATGKPVYSERLEGAGGFTASPWAAGGMVYFLDDRGKTFAVRAGKEFDVAAESGIGEMCWSTPAAAGGAVYLRGRDTLYCFADRK